MTTHISESLKKTQNNIDKWSNFVLSSHIDPIGDPNDVLCLSIFVCILCMHGVSGTYPTW